MQIWKKNIDKSSITLLDPNTELQEFALKKFKKLPQYRLMGSSGPRHNPLYKISVSIIGSKKFIGTGKSIQQAQQNGAGKLLKDCNIH